MKSSNDFFLDYKMGIEPVKRADEFPPPTFNEMREAIARGRRDSALISGSLIQAERMGLSGEDKYVLLAYQALVHLEDTHKRLMRVVSLMPTPQSFVIPSGSVPEVPSSSGG